MNIDEFFERIVTALDLTLPDGFGPYDPLEDALIDSVGVLQMIFAAEELANVTNVDHMTEPTIKTVADAFEYYGACTVHDPATTRVLHIETI